LRFSANASDHQVVAGVAIQLFSLGIPLFSTTAFDGQGANGRAVGTALASPR
jgi:hypothetical protein